MQPRLNLTQADRQSHPELTPLWRYPKVTTSRRDAESLVKHSTAQPGKLFPTLKTGFFNPILKPRSQAIADEQ